MSKVVSETCSFYKSGQVFRLLDYGRSLGITDHSTRNCAADLSALKRMSQARAEEVTCLHPDDLALSLEPTKRA
jgi:hypothetical protein